MASQLVAKGRPAAGLVFLGYPLHPPGRVDSLRDAHLARIAPPMLFIQGTRDALARWDLMEAVAARLPRATLHRVEDGDHSFRVLKRTGPHRGRGRGRDRRPRSPRGSRGLR